MQDDPAITRIHEVRLRLSEQFDHDAKKLVEHYMRLQAQHTERLLGLAKGEDTEEAPAQAWSRWSGHTEQPGAQLGALDDSTSHCEWAGIIQDDLQTLHPRTCVCWEKRMFFDKRKCWPI
jgi:hypothetical protein